MPAHEKVRAWQRPFAEPCLVLLGCSMLTVNAPGVWVLATGEMPNPPQVVRTVGSAPQIQQELQLD